MGFSENVFLKGRKLIDIKKVVHTENSDYLLISLTSNEVND